MDREVRELIELLQLRPHPEGGFYRETYRSDLIIPPDALPDRYRGPRCVCTAIYYLLTAGEVSALHRVASDEIWHFYAGDPLELLILEGKEARLARLGSDLLSGEVPQVLVPAGAWQGARVAEGGKWSLVGCTVAPGFEFEDFELASPSLADEFPEHRELIRRFMRGGGR
ncbi:hypothetical protein DRP77_02595 [Candidatus Poribacteria bacterium]|nr:MAG: hypothetical protein DRP77_02595 [Candidatus Poribacteria bacterium]